MKNIVKYLRRTKHWGIIYWRKSPNESLPRVKLEPLEIDMLLPEFPKHSLLQLIGFVDAAYATDTLTHRSVTGIVFCLTGGAVAYKSKLQATVATSSTEAEFIAAVHAAKLAKYLHTILFEFGVPQEGLTLLYEDNVLTNFV